MATTDTANDTQSPVNSQGAANQSQITPQMMALMASLAQIGQGQNSPAMSMNNGKVGNAQGQPIDPQMQKSAQKALTQYYDSHAQAALQHPDGLKALSVIANAGQPPMSTPGGTNPAGMQALQQMLQQQPQQGAQSMPTQGQPLGTNQVQNQGILTPQGPLSPGGYNQQTGQIQEPGFAIRALRGLVQGGLPGVLGGLLGPSPTQQMGISQKQAELGKTKAEATEATGRGSYFQSASKQIDKTLDGSIPLSQENKATILGSLNQLKMEQVTKLQDGLKEEVDTNTKELENLINKEPQSAKVLEHQKWANKVANLHSRNQRASIMMQMTNDAMQHLQFNNPITGAQKGSQASVVKSIQEATQRAKSLGYSDAEIQAYLNEGK